MKNSHDTPEYVDRTYRDVMSASGLKRFSVTVDETDLLVLAERDLSAKVEPLIVRLRKDILSYAELDKGFLTALTPREPLGSAPDIVRAMCEASTQAGVGPMAAVAGAFSEFVGRDLARQSREVIVENGGDIFIQGDTQRRVAIFAGESPLSMKVGILVPPAPNGIGVCTSSGTVGPSLSFGKADAVLVLSESTALADAMATALANEISDASQIATVIENGMEVAGVRGIVAIVGEDIGAIGDIELG